MSIEENPHLSDEHHADRNAEEIALSAIADVIAGSKQRPLHLWNPAHTGSVAIRIHRDGSWSYQDSKIQRAALVKLFASVLLREEDDFFLITPVEKLKIEVDDAPFVITGLRFFHRASPSQVLVATTNLGEEVIAKPEHPIWVEHNAKDEPSPYIAVRDGLNGLLTRSMWLELVEHAVEHNGKIGVWSSGHFFRLAQ